MNRFSLQTYWSARQELISQCADRLLRFFTDLMPCDASVAKWFMKGRSRKEALKHPVDVTNRETLLKLLERGRHRNCYKEIMYDIGFSIGLWNGAETNKSTDLTLTCGGYSEHIKVPNNLIIELPNQLGGLANADRMRAVLASGATAWEPDWAGIISDDAKESREFDAEKPFVDWMLYLSRKWLPAIPALPPGASAESIGAGTLIIVQDEVPDPSNDSHLENIRRVETALRRVLRASKE